MTHSVRIEVRAAEMIACMETSVAARIAGELDVCVCSRRKLRTAEDEAEARWLYGVIVRGGG